MERSNASSALGVTFVPIDLFESRFSLFIELVETGQLFQKLVFVEGSEQHGEPVSFVRIDDLRPDKEVTVNGTNDRRK